jgi:hypothetical protein
MVKYILGRIFSAFLLPLAVVALVVVLISPKITWMPGTTYKSWYSQISGCNVNAGEKCDIADTKVCWICPVFNSLFDVVSETGIKVYLKLADGAVKFLIILFAFWILYHTYFSFNFNKGVSADEYVQKILVMAAYLMVGLVLLGTYISKGTVIKSIYSNTIDPLFSMAANFGTKIMDWPACSNIADEADTKNEDEFAQGIFSQSVKKSTSCMIGSINIMLISGISAGWNLLNYFSKSGNPLDMIGGVIIIMFFAYIMVRFPLKYLDVFVNIGLVFALLPIMIVAWVFSGDERISVAKGFWETGYEIVVHSLVKFLMTCLVMGLIYKTFVLVGEFYYSYNGISYIFPDYFNATNTVINPNLGSGEFMLNCYEADYNLSQCYEHIPMPSASLSGFIPILFAVLVASYLLGKIDDYTSAIWGGSKDLDVGGSMEKLFTSLIQKTKNIKAQIASEVKK